MATITSALALPGRNLLSDPRLDTLALNPRGAVVTDTHPTSGGPDGGSFYRRSMTTANTSSPMNGLITGAGTSGIPVTPGAPLVASGYARKNPLGGPGYRFDVDWFSAAGASLGASIGVAASVGTAWQRVVQLLTPPTNAAFVQVWAVWTGTAPIGQALDLAMAQVEYGSTASTWTDNRTLHPLAVLNYATRRASRNVLLEPLGSKYPTVFLREAQSKAGTLSLLFLGDAPSREAETFLSSANRFTFSEPTVGETWDFVVTGDVGRTHQTGTSYWIVDAEVREVEPL